MRSIINLIYDSNRGFFLFHGKSKNHDEINNFRLLE